MAGALEHTIGEQCIPRRGDDGDFFIGDIWGAR